MPQGDIGHDDDQATDYDDDDDDEEEDGDVDDDDACPLCLLDISHTDHHHHHRLSCLLAVPTSNSFSLKTRVRSQDFKFSDDKSLIFSTP